MCLEACDDDLVHAKFLLSHRGHLKFHVSEILEAKITDPFCAGSCVFHCGCEGILGYGCILPNVLNMGPAGK